MMRANQKGLTLIELMISITLGLVLISGVVQMFLGSRTAFATQQAISRVQETGRLALDFMSRDIRMAGFSGCASRGLAGGTTLLNTLTAASSDTSINDFRDSVYAYSAAPAGSSLEPDPAVGSDILTLTVADATVEPLTVTLQNSASTVFVRSTGTTAPGCESGICPNDYLVAGDCLNAVVFQATAVTPDGSNLKISHDLSAPTNGIGNVIDVWPNNGRTILQTAGGATVTKINRVTYFIATRAATANDPTPPPSLWQNINGTNIELIEGVEKMALTFGYDSWATRDNVPEAYFTAAEITNHADGNSPWSRVVSINIQLLIRGKENNALADKTGYTFNGVVVPATDPVADKRLRQVFISTVAIRNRIR